MGGQLNRAHTGHGAGGRRVKHTQAGVVGGGCVGGVGVWVGGLASVVGGRSGRGGMVGVDESLTGLSRAGMVFLQKKRNGAHDTHARTRLFTARSYTGITCPPLGGAGWDPAKTLIDRIWLGVQSGETLRTRWRTPRRGEVGSKTTSIDPIDLEPI